MTAGSAPGIDGARRRRILVVVRHPVGGIRTFMRYVYRRFDPDRYEFTLLAPALPEVRVLLADDLPTWSARLVALPPGPSMREFAAAVLRVMFTRRFDLVHAHGFSSGICSTLPAAATRTPSVVTVHDVVGPTQLRGISGRSRNAALDASLAIATRIHCVGDDSRNNLLQHMPLLSFVGHKIVTIRNGIEVDRFRNVKPRDLRGELGLPANTYLIGFLGRFMSQKGFVYLVDALDSLQSLARDSARRPVLLAFSQEDGFIREEREAIRARGLQHTVLFLPFVANPAATLAGLDVVAMPSLWEACPLLPMEAMVAGVPLIASDVIGLREVVRDTPAMVVPPRDASALARALWSEMENSSVERAHAFAGEAGARFDVTGRACELEGVVQSLMTRARPAVGNHPRSAREIQG